MGVPISYCVQILSYVGAPAAPGITMLSEFSRMDNRITIKTDLQQPVYGFECVQSYTIIVRADGEVVRNDSTSAGDMFVWVSVCQRQYTFTAIACSPVGCSNESTPETIDVTDGKCTVLK